MHFSLHPFVVETADCAHNSFGYEKYLFSSSPVCVILIFTAGGYCAGSNPPNQSFHTGGRSLMAYKSDIEIAQEATLQPINSIAASLGISEDAVENYGKYKAKLDLHAMRELPEKGKLILVTAITPTPAGEGKTTTSVGLTDGLRRIGKNAVVALREPSLGPVFGIKGGAAGGGYAQVVPMEDINLHFTGDFHAIGAANNLLAAMLDNHIQQGKSVLST